jgi:peptide deformylase
VGKLDIVQAGHPVLRDRAAEITPEELGQKPLLSLVRTMIEAMRRAPGVGLAAPQIGVGKRVVVMEDAEKLMARLTPEEKADRGRVPFPLKVIVNPTLTVVSEEPVVFFEGCLSVAGYSALVPRAKEVLVRGTDEKGAPIEWQVSGWPARILQHEIDHLDGTLYVDRMLTRTFGHNDEVGPRWFDLPVAVVREKLRA